MLRIGGRPVVKREIDRSRLRRDRIGPVRRRDDHAARDGRRHAVAVRDGIGDAPLAGVEGVYVRGAFDLRGDITVAVIDGPCSRDLRIRPAVPDKRADRRR